MFKEFIALLILTHLFEQTILSRPTTRIARFCKRVLGHAYWFVRRFSDPIVRVKVRDRYLYVNTSHALVARGVGRAPGIFAV